MYSFTRFATEASSVAEKQTVWRFFRQNGNDPANRWEEFHVQHAVGFV